MAIYRKRGMKAKQCLQLPLKRITIATVSLASSEKERRTRDDDGYLQFYLFLRFFIFFSIILRVYVVIYAKFKLRTTKLLL